MTAIHLFNVVSRSNQWLSVRQATIASNVANANTPGYKALDVEPFEKVLETTRLTMQATQPGHMTDAGARASSGAWTRSAGACAAWACPPTR